MVATYPLSSRSIGAVAVSRSRMRTGIADAFLLHPPEGALQVWVEIQWGIMILKILANLRGQNVKN